MQSWFLIDGRLPDIPYPGDVSVRYPEPLVEQMLTEYSRPNDWILDPFCGFGTTLTVCSRMNRNAVGIEKNASVYAFARRLLPTSTRYHHDRAENIASYGYPKFQLILTSPPFRSFRDDAEAGFASYYDDLVAIFAAMLPALAPGARVVVETVNLPPDSDSTGMRAFRSALALSTILTFVREHICCHRDGSDVVTGCQHSYLLVFRRADAPELCESTDHVES